MNPAVNRNGTQDWVWLYNVTNQYLRFSRNKKGEITANVLGFRVSRPQIQFIKDKYEQETICKMETAVS